MQQEQSGWAILYEDYTSASTAITIEILPVVQAAIFGAK
jgi:hypothetical protein